MWDQHGIGQLVCDGVVYIRTGAQTATTISHRARDPSHNTYTTTVTAPSAPNTRAAADTRELSGVILLACRTVGGGGVCACVIGPQFAFCAGRRTNVSAIRWDGAARGGVRSGVWGRGCYVRYVCLCAYELTVVLLGAHAVC